MEFTFNASALGAAGVIERGGVVTTIPSLASVALAPTGGEGRSVVANYFSEELEFAHAETRVYGRQVDDKPSFTTSTYVLIAGLRVFDRLRVAEMRATVTSTRGFEDDDDHDFLLDLSYTGIELDGRQLLPKIDVCLGSLRRYDQLGQVLKPGRLPQGLTAPRDVKSLAQRFNASSPAELAGLLGARKPVQGTIVESIEGWGPKAVSPSLFVSGLGTVRFGEFMLKPGSRRLNLLRINFGTPAGSAAPKKMMKSASLSKRSSQTDFTGGSMTMGSVEGNGTPIGP